MRSRVKIEIVNPDAIAKSGRFVYGRDVRLLSVLEDGTAKPIPGVKTISWRCSGRTEPCLVTAVMFADPPEAVLDAEIVEANDLLDRIESLEKQLAECKRELRELRSS